MHLVPCIRPEGALEPAPATSLGEAAAGERWDGFWSISDERFYTRCVGPSGRERWFLIADVPQGAAPGRRGATRILPFPGSADRGPRMIVGRYRGKAMLVGTRQRRSPAKTER